MNVQTFQVDPTEARRKLQEYRGYLHRKADNEFQKIADAYRAAADGKPIVELTKAIRSAPVDDQGRPRLAIARSDRKEVRLSWWDKTLHFDSRAARGGGR